MSTSPTRGQSGLEFLVFFTVAVSVISILLLLIVIDRNEVEQKNLILETSNLADSIAATMNEVVIGGDGMSLPVSLPPRIGNLAYYVLFENNSVYVILPGEGMGHAAPLIASANANWTYGNHRIRNSGGTIVLE